MLSLNSNPLVSILIPAFNCEQYIDKCFESILNQTYPNIELLIVDDGSKDNTWKLIKKQTDLRIKKFRFKKNKGNIEALNFLLQKAKGEFIGFQDADDWSDVNRINIQMDFLKNNPEVFLCGTDYRYVEPDNTLTELYKLPFTHTDIVKYIEDHQHPPFCAASCIIRKEVYETVGGFRNYFNRIGCGDFDWHYRIIEKFKAANLENILYYYRKTPSSITTTISSDIRKLISDKIAYHLYTQRKNTGTDSLLGNTLKDIDQLTERLLPEYINDPSLIFHKKALFEIQNYRLAKGLQSVIICLRFRPFKKRNISLFKYWCWKVLIRNKLIRYNE